MVNIERVLDRIAILESQMAELRTGLTVSNQLVADFFPINTLPGQELLNNKIAELDNVAILNGRATLLDRQNSFGTLKTTAFPLDITTAGTIELIPVNESVQGIFEYTPETTKTCTLNAILGFSTNRSNYNIDIVPPSGVNDYGVHLNAAISEKERTDTFSFEYGAIGSVWTLKREHVDWRVVNLDGDSTNTSHNNVLVCETTTSATSYPAQESMESIGIALTTGCGGETFEIRTAMRTMTGYPVKMGIAMQMKDILNGYLALLETDSDGSYVRLYKVQAGLISKINEISYEEAFATSQCYVVAGQVNNKQINIFVNDVLVLQHLLSESDVVSMAGNYGVACAVPSVAQYCWIQTKSKLLEHSPASYGEAITDEFVSSDVFNWQYVEVDTSILHGRIELEYSIDGGITFGSLPNANICYPEPSTKTVSLASVPFSRGQANKIKFKIKLYETGTDGWVRQLRVYYQTEPRSSVILDNIQIINNTFSLCPYSGLAGTITTSESFLPGQIQEWDCLVTDEYKKNSLSLELLNSKATIEVDSFQDEHNAASIFDSDVETYWESKRSSESWICFSFPSEVELCSFRWIKKSLTDSATYYRLQRYNAEQNAFEDIHSYGYEVNADITHVLPYPVIGTRFRIWIDCLQPFSFGNARYIELLGRSVIGGANISYEYSQDDGVSFARLSNLSLKHLNRAKGIKLRITLQRNTTDIDIYLKKFGYRFIGRDSSGKQLTDIKYDLKIGDNTLADIPINTPINVRHFSGRTLQLMARFLGDTSSSQLLPTLGGYKIAVNSSGYQTQIDELRTHIEAIMVRADKDFSRDSLVDAILSLILHELHQHDSTMIHDHLTTIYKELAILRSRIALGDSIHINPLFPAYIFNVPPSEQ